MSNLNMTKMMKQLQKAQSDMNKMQNELADKIIEATSGGGAVTVTVNGQKELIAVKIEPEVITADNKEMLEDLLVAAVNEAFQRVDDMVAAEMQNLTGGLNLPPGMF